MLRYYVDTCIWIDYWEDRREFGGYAARFFLKAMSHRMIISQMVIAELRNHMSEKDIMKLMRIFSAMKILDIVDVTAQDIRDAGELASERGIPANDALHALIASRNKAILVTQDRHFLRLKDIANVKRPQDL